MVDSEDEIIIMDVVSPFNLQGKKKGFKECARGCSDKSFDAKVSFFLSSIFYFWVMNQALVFVVYEPFIDGTHKDGDVDRAEDLGFEHNGQRSLCSCYLIVMVEEKPFFSLTLF